MSNNNEEIQILKNRFDTDTQTCYGKEFDGFFVGLLHQFRDTFFYALILQFLLVALMYKSVGKGIYWKVLFYASLAGILGSIFENGTIAYVCQESKKEESISKVYFVPLFVDEIFWILSEYAIPYLNLTKMKAFASGKLNTIVRYTILGLFIPFVIFRFMIGHSRMEKGYLSDKEIQAYHGYAFGVMAAADLICTFAILYFVSHDTSQANSSANLNHYIKHSSYTILIWVDIVSVLLSVLNIINNVSSIDNPTLSALAVPFHCFKSSFVLILATDALLFKYGANVISIGDSSGNNSKNYGSSGHNLIGYKSISFNNAKNSHGSKSLGLNIDSGIGKSTSTNSYYKKSNVSNISNIVHYNYPPIEKDMMYTAGGTSKNGSPTFAPSKSIIKNYTNISTNSLLFNNSSDHTNAYSKNFGFMNNQVKSQY
ncbi:hypothetical protein BCR36DRAFT_584050 [Piromyces finnis]|uniref:Uncharacterized protein n=1 Tax=Piromyces finnis TaxID=1754191 RepID=A0A1Y1V853_9FUNG|nr:hypothetical protein BCR36DRAFT_584050 [Piromyces finnis]|eukprot:ORX48934.1 hypothetical protein BCR36DRAFT_584050 [Piromyces finnis]